MQNDGIHSRLHLTMVISGRMRKDAFVVENVRDSLPCLGELGSPRFPPIIATATASIVPLDFYLRKIAGALT